ncbi:MAG: hypothetical protein ACE5FU_05685 [Nitrospinota bacterium]
MEKMKSKTEDTSQLTDSFLRLAKLNTEIMKNSITSMGPFVKAYAKLVEGVMLMPWRMGASRCTIPETKCPPYCVCTLTWHACEGDKRTGRIHIENTSRQPISYTIEAVSFRSGGKDSAVKPSISPDTLNIPAGKSAAVDVAVTVDNNFDPDRTYKSEVKIRGKYERCICLTLKVGSCCNEFCEIDHGDIPTRIRADQWYRHFQCTEECFEPANSRYSDIKPESQNDVRRATIVVDQDCETC